MLSDLLDAPIVNKTQVLYADKKELYTGSWKIIKTYSRNKYFALENVKEKDKMIYIVRDFRDVLISAFFFNNKNIDEDRVRIYSGKQNFIYRQYFRYEIKRMNKQWVENELTVFRNFLQGRMFKRNKVGNWSEHVRFGLQLPM